jgi:acyl-CoA thioester hydrolase
MTGPLRHRVRYHEVDAQGFMFNSRYLELADVAMAEFFRDLGFPYRELVARGTDPSVVKANIEFRRPARFEDVLVASVTCLRVGVPSFDLATFVSREGDGVEIADMRLTYVNVDAEQAVARPLIDEVAEALRRATSGSAAGPVGHPPMIRCLRFDGASGSLPDHGALSDGSASCNTPCGPPSLGGLT